MNFLIVVNKDGPNLFIENIVREIANRGHNIKMFSVFSDDNSLRMFKNLNLEIKNISELTKRVVAQADCIFCPVQSLAQVKFADKYIFSFCNMNPKFDEVRGADFVFTLSSIGEDGIKTFASMPVGLPKNDTAPAVNTDVSKRILVIDSGHFPFGRAGREQVAGMILNICKEFPDYEVCVKPRWLKDCDAGSMTHENTLHLYDVIDEMCAYNRPKNLNLLQEHLDLQQLIDSSTSVVSLCTTAYLDVALRGKGLLIARGIENEDMYQVRKAYFDRVYDYAEGSGCVVDYKDVCRYLPEGKNCRPEHLTETFTYTTDVSKKVVDVMEDIYEKYLKNQRFPAIREYSYESYKQELTEEDGLTMEDLKRNRMYSLVGNSVALCRSISANIDWTPYYQKQLELCYEAKISEEGFKQLKLKLGNVKCEYMIQNADKLMENPVDRGYLYEAMRLLGKTDLLLSYKSLEELHNGAYDYYCGLIYYKKKNYRGAICYLEKFLEDLKKRSYKKYLVEAKSYARAGILALMECYINEQETDCLVKLLELWIKDGYHNSIQAASDKVLETAFFVALEYPWMTEKYPEVVTEYSKIYRRNRKRKKIQNLAFRGLKKAKNYFMSWK